jgi:hypothetical protein
VVRLLERIITIPSDIPLDISMMSWELLLPFGLNWKKWPSI